MRNDYADGWNRREFLGRMTLAGAAGLFGMGLEPVGAEPPPETTKFRPVLRIGSVCTAPMFLTEEFLQGEGFTDVQYVKKETTVAARQALASGEGDMTMAFSAPTIVLIDAGDPIVLLAGVHVGASSYSGRTGSARSAT